MSRDRFFSDPATHSLSLSIYIHLSHPLCLLLTLFWASSSSSEFEPRSMHYIIIYIIIHVNAPTESASPPRCDDKFENYSTANNSLNEIYPVRVSN